MPPPPTFPLFGADHLGALAATGLATAALTLALRATRRARDVGPKVRAVACYAVAATLIATAAAGDLRDVAAGAWSVAASLPLHLCDLAGFVTAAALVAQARGAPPLASSVRGSRNARQEPAPGARQRLYELSYYWGLGGAPQALLTPDVRAPFPTPEYLVFFVNHGAVVAAVVGMTAGLGLRPRRDSFLRAWTITLATGLVVFGLNVLLGSNYMYLARPPDNPSLYDYFGPWPWSLLVLAAVGTLVLALCYAPFFVRDRLAARSS